MPDHYDKAQKRGHIGEVRSPLILSGNQMKSFYGELDSLNKEKDMVREYDQLLVSEPAKQWGRYFKHIIELNSSLYRLQ